MGDNRVAERVRDFLARRLGSAIPLTHNGEITADYELEFLAGIQAAFQRKLPPGLRARFDLTTKEIYFVLSGKHVEIVGFDEHYVLFDPKQ